MTFSVDKLTEELIRDEGLVLKPYKDTVGKLTIGVGRNLDDVGISKEEAKFLLKNDINNVVRDVSYHFPWVFSLSDARIRGVLNMAFNLGIARLSGFTKLLTALKNKDWDAAYKEALDSKWANQVGSRAVRIAEIFRDG